ncbi:hypothetical protein, partial [Nocardioides alkalitolerans]|uniref:hypothetical protein n=1 Tax=Nocardioides alkalitolerans TaxID=281714 RepID=UPI0004913312
YDPAAFLPVLPDFAATFAALQPKYDPAAFLPVLPDFAAMIAALRPTFDAADFGAEFARLATRTRPRNLRAAVDLDFEAVAAIMIEEGLPFFLVPDAGTAQQLVEADTSKDRRAILVSRSTEILAACSSVLSLCVKDDLPFHGAALSEAITAYEAGFFRSAQAMASSVLDSVLREYESITHRDYVVGRKSLKGGIKGASYVETLRLRPWFALLPLEKVHSKDERPNPPQVAFSRNGTAHRVTPEQFTRANSVHALMVAASIIGFAQGLW